MSARRPGWGPSRVPDDMDWSRYGDCQNYPDINFYAVPPDFGPQGLSKKQAAEVAKAKTVCSGCPVRAECLDHALSLPESYGVWGGHTPHERGAIRSRQPSAWKNPSLAS